MIILIIFIQSPLCQMQLNILQGNLFSANWIALKLITVCRWRTNCQSKCSHSILLAELLPIKDLQRVLTDLCLLFQDSCVSTWTQLSKLTNVLHTWTTLKLQQTMVRILTGTFGQSSSHSPSRIEIGKWKVQFWSKTGWISGQNLLMGRCISTNSWNTKLSQQLQLPQIRKGFTMLPGLREMLQKIYSQVGWKIQSILQTLKNRGPSQHRLRIERNLWFKKKVLSDACELALK